MNNFPYNDINGTISKAKWKRVEKLYRSELSIQAVANKLDVSIGAVIYVLRTLDVPRRTAAAQRIELLLRQRNRLLGSERAHQRS